MKDRGDLFQDRAEQFVSDKNGAVMFRLFIFKIIRNGSEKAMINYTK